MKKENDKTLNEITQAAFHEAAFSNKDIKEMMADWRKHMGDMDIIWGGEL